MDVVVTGATGLIGRRLVAALRQRGDDVAVLSRDPGAAEQALEVSASAWDPLAEPPAAGVLAGRDAVVHLAGAPVAQRWSERTKREIVESRVVGTRHLVEGLRACDGAAPPTLISASAVGYYGPCGDERLEEDAVAGQDFLAGVCVAWEREALAAQVAGLRVACVRTGVVLDRDGGALAKMLAPFRLGVGGPVAGGRQYMPWIHADDLVALYLAALDDERYAGPINGSAPEPVPNATFSRALGRALHRPAVLPVPGFALWAMYGDMAEIVTTGQRAVPARALTLGFEYAHPDLDEALADALR